MRWHANCVQGDSGGPLTYESSGQHILIGETSYGPFPCGGAGQYGVYGRISHYRLNTKEGDRFIERHCAGPGLRARWPLQHTAQGAPMQTQLGRGGGTGSRRGITRTRWYRRQNRFYLTVCRCSALFLIFKIYSIICECKLSRISCPVCNYMWFKYAKWDIIVAPLCWS